MSRRRRATRTLLVVVLVASIAGPVRLAGTEAATLPSGFQEQIVFTGLNQPTNIEFAPDGRIFVAEKAGRIKVFDNLADQTPTLFADLSTNVHGVHDRGLLGLALPPTFPTDPWVYVLYAYDAPPGGTAPVYNDSCSGNNDNCVVTGRLSRLQASGNVMTGTEQVLVHDWCQQYWSHSIGDLHFGADGMLYVTGGDGASYNVVDYGQLGNPRNPCADPPGGTMTPPTAEGGALRSQDVRSTADATQLHGAVLRLDPVTGAAAPGNPLIGSADPNARRIVAQGLRNPFRFTIRPGTNEVWVGDVGWNNWEEVNRVVNPTASVTNFGWPCYEGSGRMAGYDSANLTLCESLYSGAGQTAPYYTYNHSASVVAGDGCPTGGSSVAGGAFYPTSGGPYPADYRGALFFADYSRDCIWAMKPTTPGGLPAAGNIQGFAAGAANPVDLAIGPGGELYYADLGGGTVRRIRYFPGNQPPTAVLAANPTAGALPLTVNFSAAGSTDADPADAGLLTYAWDFTNDGTTDATGVTASFTYTTAGPFTARLTVRDTLAAADTTTVTITPGSDAPTAVIDTPAASLTWSVGQAVTFSGHATDPQDGVLPASAFAWRLRLQHCFTLDNCHTHFVQEWSGITGGSFATPDHDYPSYLELELETRDSSNLSSTVVRRLDPKTVNLTFNTVPSGLTLTVGSSSQVSPFTRTVIQGSTNSLSAPTPQTAGGTTYTFGSWSDGGAQTHVITAPATATSYTATYAGSTTSCGTDAFGYACATIGRPLVATGTVLPMTGDEDREPFGLPFPFRFYGQTYTTAWADMNGFLGFGAVASGQTWENQSIPATGIPNGAVYPFWDDLMADASSSVRTGTGGTAPNRYFAVEWRNVFPYGVAARRVTAQAVLHESGEIALNYADIDPAQARERGNSATVGIENAAGTVALRFAFNTASLTNGNAIVFTPPAPTFGAVAGTVTRSGTPVAGATVRVGTEGRSAVTAANGTYQISNVPAGTHTVTVLSPDCGRVQASVTVTSGTATANLAVTVPTDTAGYTCSAGPRSLLAAGTVLPMTDDEDVEQVPLPFTFRYYGQQYTTAWVDMNGLLGFGSSPGVSTWENASIPATGAPNAAVYPFWDDLMADGTSSVRTGTGGSAPDRYFVVEWRDVFPYGEPWLRVTVQVVLYENGEVVFNYANLDAAQAREGGGSATVGIESPAGTAGLRFSLNTPSLTSGTALMFRPPA